MDKFAIVAIPDGPGRIIDTHPILKHFPRRLALEVVPKISPRTIGTIKDNETDEELGRIIDVPGFFNGWDKLPREQKNRQLQKICETLKRMDCNILSIPFNHDLMGEEEKTFLENNNIIILDGYKFRMATMLLGFCRFLKGNNKMLHKLEAGVWRGDSQMGEIWARVLAPSLNFMSLGGENVHKLINLSERIIKNTGLSCQLVSNSDDCIQNKNLIVITENHGKGFLPNGSIILLASKKWESYDMPQLKETILIESGWMNIPNDISVDTLLKPWEEIALLDGILYIISDTYRNIIDTEYVSEKHLEKIIELLNLYPLTMRGFIKNGNQATFDEFRRIYFRKFPNKNNNDFIS